MKPIFIAFALVVIVASLMTGCGAKSPDSSAAENPNSPMSASELSRLMDFHAWKVSIPESQRPFKSIRLIIVNRDGTFVAQKFSTEDNLHSEPCTFILIGFRIEQGTFTGHFNTFDAKGGGLGWKLDFTDAFADTWPAWSEGNLVWNGNRAELAVATKDGEMKDYKLVIELVK
jgi:hypothetical protein